MTPRTSAQSNLGAPASCRRYAEHIQFQQPDWRDSWTCNFYRMERFSGAYVSDEKLSTLLREFSCWANIAISRKSQQTKRLLCKSLDLEVAENTLSLRLSPTLLPGYQTYLPSNQLIHAKKEELYASSDNEFKEAQSER